MRFDTVASAVFLHPNGAQQILYQYAEDIVKNEFSGPAQQTYAQALQQLRLPYVRHTITAFICYADRLYEDTGTGLKMPTFQLSLWTK